MRAGVDDKRELKTALLRTRYLSVLIGVARAHGCRDAAEGPELSLKT